MLLLTGGWLLASFPILIFLGLAPLMALAEPRGNAGSSFEKMELVLLALTGSLLLRAFVEDHSLVAAFVVGILYTLAFIAHAWVRQVSGMRAGKITLVLFWLSTEYLMLKLAPEHGLFLADSLTHTPGWQTWNVHTGYLGATLWVLMVNVAGYQAFLKDSRVSWIWLGLGIIFLAAPLLYAFTLGTSPVTREEMINFYANKATDADVTYLARGELVVRTAAWLSALILLFTLVRQQTRK